ncbi:hypothetical protein IP92_04597 [Pseudoduganella flava]|nr:hypothetical protein IP92_04597 [Pseudoduganella flava]
MDRPAAIRRRARIAATLVCLYFVGSYLFLNFGPGGQLIDYATAPALLLVIVWTPVLRPLGLTEGTWMTAPTVPACIAIVLLYGALAYRAVLALAGARGRSTEGKV